MILFAGLLYAGLLVWDCIRFRIPFRSILTGFAICILISPLLCANRRMIGYPVLDTRHATVFNLVSEKIPPLKQLVYSDPIMPVDIVIPTVETAPEETIGHMETTAQPSVPSAPTEQLKPRTGVFLKFLNTIWGGIFPFFLFFAVIGIIGHIRRCQWSGFDTFLILTFLVFELLAAFQVCLFYGQLATSRRYLFIGITLYLPFTALGFRDSWRVLSDLKFGKSIITFLSVLLCAGFFYKLYSPIFTEFFHDSVKGIERDIQIAAAEWIRTDWDNLDASQDESQSLRLMKCDQYQSGKRPLIKTNIKWTRLGFMAGGQIYPDFLLESDILPDYIVLPAEAINGNSEGNIPDFIGFDEKVVDGTVARQYRQVHVDTIDGITFAVFRNSALQPRD